EKDDQQGAFLLVASDLEPSDHGKAHAVAISAVQGSALSIEPGSDAAQALDRVLADPTVPKAIHDWKAATHALAGVALEGVQHDTKLYSYLVDPTYSSHSVAELALRRFNLKIGTSLTEAADMTGRLAAALRKEIEDEKL